MDCAVGNTDEGEQWSGGNLWRACKKKKVAVTQNRKGFSNRIPNPKDRVDHLKSQYCLFFYFNTREYRVSTFLKTGD